MAENDPEKEKPRKLPRKKDIKYILCQHLREGTQNNEHYAAYAGDNTRIIYCPFCHKIHLGGMLRILKTIDLWSYRDPDFQHYYVGNRDEFLEQYWLEDTRKVKPEELKKSKLQRIFEILSE